MPVLKLCVPLLQSEVQFSVDLHCLIQVYAMRRDGQLKSMSNQKVSVGEAPLALVGMPVLALL